MCQLEEGTRVSLEGTHRPLPTTIDTLRRQPTLSRQRDVAPGPGDFEGWVSTAEEEAGGGKGTVPTYLD